MCESASPHHATLRASSYQMKCISVFCDMLSTSSSLNEVQNQTETVKRRNKRSFKLSFSNAALDLSLPVLKASNSSCKSDISDKVPDSFSLRSIYNQSIAANLIVFN